MAHPRDREDGSRERDMERCGPFDRGPAPGRGEGGTAQGLRGLLIGTLRLQGCGEGLGGHPDEVVGGGARHGAQLEKVAGHG